ncbi:MAG: TraB/GumN family protein [Deltaproteobacteria bacterium]|nr:TraB/GumN family protein [Deltaproteobacteria bacterium]
MLDENIHKLIYEDREISLVGTAHVSKESADLVKRIIEEEKPDTVCVELCESRYQAITQKDQWKETNLIKVIREKKALLLLLNFLLASFQKRIGHKLGIKPGEEMLQAIHAAQEVKAEILLADRDIRTTLSRTWRMIGFWTKIKFIFQLILSMGEMEDISEEDIEAMKKKDVLESILAEIGETLPQLKSIIIDERDRYLAYKIRKAPGRRIVAAVGAGHVPGIMKYWNEEIDIQTLEQMPSRNRFVPVLKWVIPVAIIGMIIAGFFMAGASAGKEMVKYWVIANALLAGIGAAIAFAHPVTILSAVFASPITSLNPMIAAGWVAGLVEVFFGKPKVKDFEALAEDILSIRGFWRNKITRILMVVVFTNMGSSLGALVAIPLMVRVFS